MSVPEKPATKEVQQLCDQVRPDLEARENKMFTTYLAISYRTRVVAGTNYFVKVNVGDEYYHLEIFVPLPNTGQPLSLTAYWKGHTEESALTFSE